MVVGISKIHWQMAMTPGMVLNTVFEELTFILKDSMNTLPQSDCIR